MSNDGLGSGYDSWRLYVEDCDHSSDQRCSDCEMNEQRFDNAREYFDDILRILYGKEKYRIGKLEECIDEVCSALKMKFPNGELQIQKKNKTDTILQNWVEYNQKHLKEIA